ncbi:MAG: zinc-dependent alcohol dehydrogenase [Thermodesulfobacteriota bacterium]
MRALQITGIQKIEPVEVPAPEADGQHVLIQVAACGICGSDLHYWQYGFGLGGISGLIPGHEFCGTVVDPGARQDLAAADRVTALPIDPCNECRPCGSGHPNLCANALKRSIPGNNSQGGFAEYLLLRPDMVRKLPDGIDDRSACVIEPAAVALHAIYQGSVKTGDQVLVVGGGTIGRLAAKWARIAGASFIALAETNAHRRSHAEENGDVDAVFDPIASNVQRQMKQQTGGGFNVAVETSAASGGINAAMKALRWQGRMVMAGIALNPQKLMTAVHVFNELTVSAAMGYLPAEFDRTLDYMANHRLQPANIVTGAIGFAECQSAFTQLSSGQPDAVKILVTP